jgi:hypothetical protein
MAKENGKPATHGVSKRRTWRKLHLALDEATAEILARVASGNDTADCEVLANKGGIIPPFYCHLHAP